MASVSVLPVPCSAPTDSYIAPVYEPPAPRKATNTFLGALCIGTALLNVLLLVTLPSPPSISGPFQRLRRPSAYYGLNDVKSAPKAKSVVTHPILLSQVSRGQSDKVMADDEHQYMTPRGSISPYEQHLLVTEDVRPDCLVRMGTKAHNFCRYRRSPSSACKTTVCNDAWSPSVYPSTAALLATNDSCQVPTLLKATRGAWSCGNYPLPLHP